MESAYQQIETYKTQREIAMKEFREIDYQKNDALSDYFFRKFQNGTDIPFELLDQMEEGKAISLPVVHGGAIITVKQKVDKDDTIEYTTEWTSGSTLTFHYHSNCVETIEVISGSAKVYVEGQVMILLEGNILEVGSNVRHQVTAMEPSKMNIGFKKVPNYKIKTL